VNSGSQKEDSLIHYAYVPRENCATRASAFSHAVEVKTAHLEHV
jgi:hypothetical protein